MEKPIRVSGQTALNVCGCGRLHLTYGPITLHFEAIEFTLFAADVARIVAHLRRTHSGPEHPLPAEPTGSPCH